MSSSFLIKSKPPIILTNESLKDELHLIKSLCAKHEMLCCAFAKWKSDIEQNDAQLEILNETALALRNRHKVLTDMLTNKSGNPDLLNQLQREISAVETQVDIWIRELADINDDRMRLDIEFIKLRTQLLSSMTNIEIAQLDLDSMERRHKDMWKNFLYNTAPKLTAVSPSTVMMSVTAQKFGAASAQS
jgi:chromosome segregation ATPase